MKTVSLKILYNLVFLTIGLALAGLWAGQALSAGGGGDLWFARALGRTLSDPSGLPAFETFAHTIPADAAFKAGGWLYAVAIYQLGQHAGSWSLDLWRMAAMVCIYLSVVAAAYRRGGRPFSAGVAALAALLSFWNADLAFLSSAALFALALYIMEGPFWSSLFSRWLWLAPLLALAANIHASVLAIALLAAAWALSEKDLSTEAPPDNPRLSRLIFVCALISCVALNFNGFALWGALNQDTWNLTLPLAAPPGGLVWLSSPWLSLILPSIAIFFLLANSWVAGGQYRWRRDMVCALTMALIVSLRPDWLPLAALWAAPLASARLDAVVKALPVGFRQVRWLIKIPLLAVLLWAAPVFKIAWRSHPAYAQRGFPDRVIAFLREQDLGMRFYHSVDWAGFLLWYLPGRAKVFLDSRLSLAYSDSVLTDYRGAQGGGLGGPKEQLELWREIFNRRKIDTVLLKIDSPLARTMARAGGWQPVFFDNESVLYVRADKKHKTMIKTWAPRGLRPGDLHDPFDRSRLQQTETDLEVRLARDPHMGILYLFQSAVRRARQDSDGSLESLRQGIRVDPTFTPNYRQLGEALVRRGLYAEARQWWKKSLKINEDPTVRHLLEKYGELQ